MARVIENKTFQINGIVSFDVLEHIYNVESHIKKLASLSKDRLQIVYASGANIENPLYVRHQMKEHNIFEKETRQKKWGHKERDSLESFFNIRKNIIREHASDLSPDIVEWIAGVTRGLIREDIIKCIDEFQSEGSISYHIDHPTNTCDPYTGNWQENLIDLKWLKQVIEKYGFTVFISPGYFHQQGAWYKIIIKTLINILIKLLGRRGMIISPYYIVCAKSNKSDFK